MVIRKAALALAASALLFSGCEVQSPSSSSDNKTPQVSAEDRLPQGVDGLNPDNKMPYYTTPTDKTVALWDPFRGSSAHIPFPVDLLFEGSTDGTLNIPNVTNSGSNETPAMPYFAEPMVALNTVDGFSTTAMLTIAFSKPIDDDQDNFAAGIRIFQMKGSDKNPADRMRVVGDGTQVEKELVYGVDFVASVSGDKLIVLPLRPLASGTTHRIVVTTSLKDEDGESVSAYGAYQAHRKGELALFPDVKFYESELQAYTQASPFPPLVLKGLDPSKLVTDGGAIVPLVAGENGGVALSYGVTTQNVNGALAAAQSVVKANAAPIIGVSPLSTSTILGQGGVPVDANGNPTAPPGVAVVSVNDLVTGAAQASNTQIYVGAVSGMTSFIDPENPVHSVWNSSGNNLSPLNGYVPSPQGDPITIPVLVTAPNADAPAPAPAPAGTTCEQVAQAQDGYPVVIFQHGITRNRADMLALAGTLTKMCAVGVAIDMPEHGITADNSLVQLAAALGQRSALFSTPERLVNKSKGMIPQACIQTDSSGNPVIENGGTVDLHSADVRLDGADEVAVCGSGDGYVNLTNLANARDVIRQTVIDLDSLYLALKQNGVMIVDATGAPVIVDGAPLNLLGTERSISFVGHSLGAIAGSTFLATLDGIDGELNAAVFNVGGAGIAKLLDGSPAFRGKILAGLAGAEAFEQMTSAEVAAANNATYQQFLIAAQTLVDSADPINYADKLASLTSGTAPVTPILYQEVVGGGVPDLVVPNNVFGDSQIGEAWRVVSGSPQTGWLAGQGEGGSLPGFEFDGVNYGPIQLAPAALGGTDSLVQGTAFVSSANIVEQYVTAADNLQALLAIPEADRTPEQQATITALTGAVSSLQPAFDCVSDFGPLCPVIEVMTQGFISAYTGIGLPQVDSDGEVKVDMNGATVSVPAPYGVVRYTVGDHGSLLSPDASPNATVLMQTQLAAFLAGLGVVGEAACEPAICSGVMASWTPLQP